MTGTVATATRRSSGVDWLGDIPVHWRVANIRKFATMKTGHTPSRSVPTYWENCTIPWFTLGDVWQLRDGNRKFLGETREQISALGLANSAAELLPSGTVVLSRTASVGFPGIMPIAMATSQDYWNWICGPDLLPDYLYWVFRGMADEFRAMMHGSTHKTIYEDAAAAMQIPIPPFAEQRQIAHYLDAECARLDRLIELRARQIALAFERRDVVVTERVTRGIAPSTTVIDTALPWIGKAPSHWVVQTIRRLDPHIESGTSVNASDVVPADDELGVLKTGAASKGWFDPDESKTVWGEDHGRVTCPVVDGALLLNRANTPALVGTTAFVNRAPRNLYLSDKLWQIKFGRASERFVWWWTKTSVYRKQVESFCVGASSSMQNLAKDDFRSIAIALPPIEEQELIAADLEARVGELQRAITAMARSIELLRERKQALITAAVTGEFDVTAASGRGV